MFRIILKKLREDAGYSQYSFAKTFGVAQSTVGGWESGAREPKIDTLNKIAEFFNVSVDFLLGREDFQYKADEYTEYLHKRPEMKVLFDKTKNASKEDIEKAIKIIDALRDDT